MAVMKFRNCMRNGWMERDPTTRLSFQLMLSNAKVAALHTCLPVPPCTRVAQSHEECTDKAHFRRVTVGLEVAPGSVNMDLVRLDANLLGSARVLRICSRKLGGTVNSLANISLASRTVGLTLVSSALMSPYPEIAAFASQAGSSCSIDLDVGVTSPSNSQPGCVTRRWNAISKVPNLYGFGNSSAISRSFSRTSCTRERVTLTYKHTLYGVPAASGMAVCALPSS